MRQAYLEIESGLTYREKLERGQGTLMHVHVWFIPAKDLDCTPPYLKGVKTCRWISYNPAIKKLNVHDKANAEFFVGLELEPLPQN